MVLYIYNLCLFQVGAKTLARGICGKDLNKKGTPGGEVPVPESGGLAVGCAFLLCVICFELLHYYDIPSLVQWASQGFTGQGPRWGCGWGGWGATHNTEGQKGMYA